MTIQAINGNERTHHSALSTLGQGALLGAATGYAGKYLLPLTHEEKNSDEYIKVMEKIRDQKTEYTIRTKKYLDGIMAKKNRSLAEDEFVKLFDGMKEGEHVKHTRIRNALRTLEAENPLEALDFRNICKETSKIAEKTARQCTQAYKLVTKHIRPTAFFVTTGAVAGAAIALVGEALKTDVRS